jgi:hypothetical protein
MLPCLLAHLHEHPYSLPVVNFAPLPVEAVLTKPKRIRTLKPETSVPETMIYWTTLGRRTSSMDPRNKR